MLLFLKIFIINIPPLVKDTNKVTTSMNTKTNLCIKIQKIAIKNKMIDVIILFPNSTAIKHFQNFF